MTDREMRRARMANHAANVLSPTQLSLLSAGDVARDIKEELDASDQDRRELGELVSALAGCEAYVDEAKNAATLGGRIAGEPLADFIKQMIEDTR